MWKFNLSKLQANLSGYFPGEKRGKPKKWQMQVTHLRLPRGVRSGLSDQGPALLAVVRKQHAHPRILLLAAAGTYPQLDVGVGVEENAAPQPSRSDACAHRRKIGN